MRLLLDSHVVLWWLADDQRLGPQARDLIASEDVTMLSVVTPWELGIKRARGELTLPDGFDDALRDEAFEMLPITGSHVRTTIRLPLHHRDPFDRMLIAQAIEEQLTLVTADRAFDVYDGVAVLSASV